MINHLILHEIISSTIVYDRPHEYRTGSAIVQVFLEWSHSFPQQGDSAKLAGVNVRTKFQVSIYVYVVMEILFFN